MKVSIAVAQDVVEVDRGLMRRAARAVLEGEGISDYEISLAFVDNPTIHALNNRYLDHDETTDVLSFPLGQCLVTNASDIGTLAVGATSFSCAARNHT